MDWIRLINSTKTKLRADNARSSVPIHRTLQWPRSSDAHSNTTHPNRNKRHRHNLNIPTIALALFTCVPTYAQTDVGGVSATANPIANSSGSVTNQAIQVLQGPYVTSQMGDGISCQGATFNFTPYITGNISQQHPYDPIYQDPVYNNVDADDDGVPDNPGQILYYVPTRTGQKNNTNVSVGMSATWSRPLDKEQIELCKTAATLHNEYRAQLTANKRLDFEIARLKNCGELMKAGIVFHPKSPYHAVCADVMLVNPPGVVGQHTHTIDVSSQDLDLSFSDTHQQQSQNVSDGSSSDRGWRWPWSKPALSQGETHGGADQLKALQVGHWPPQP